MVNDPKQQPAEPEQDEQDEPLREEDVTVADSLDDRVEEGEGLPDGDGQ